MILDHIVYIEDRMGCTMLSDRLHILTLWASKLEQENLDSSNSLMDSSMRKNLQQDCMSDFHCNFGNL